MKKIYSDKNKNERSFFRNWMSYRLLILIQFLLIGFSFQLNAQFLKANGSKIVDGSENEIILRGIGLGGWMLQEGYMLRTSGPQHEIEAKIKALIGEEKTEEFYDQWLANHCRKIDIDSMAAWGFNSIRLPMHYKLFTPPIENEPVAGQITWNEKGFAMVDSLLAWVNANNMYLILDMHAAPGGQGENADISDYDRTKPSLWESAANREKLVALWKKLAERYANDPGIGAYDLLNETNWGFQNHSGDLNGCAETSNVELWNLQKEITETIREVDQNHMIIIEGNCWGNNYSGLPVLWDDNIVISYHKYWNSNEQSSIQGMLNMRQQRNVPIWLGETGENSNSWFTDAISLFESNDMGWSWWPLKKMGGNNPLQIEVKEGYQAILDYWDGKTSKPSEQNAYNSLMELTEGLKLENNIFHPDVVDAMIRQPHSDETLPFINHTITDSTSYLFAVDYDLGSVNNAYYDEEYTNETGNAGGLAWNQGYAYRNDGVDIEGCADVVNNGFNVGWTSDGEWLQYTVNVDSTAVYDIDVRYAALNNGSSIKILVDNSDQTDDINLPSTGGYKIWNMAKIENVVLYKGTRKIKVFIETGGFNLNYLHFERKKKVDEISFQAISAETSENERQLYVNLNKNIDPGSLDEIGFTCTIDGDETAIVLLEVSAANSQLILETEDEINDESIVKISYNGDQVKATDNTLLESFSNLEVKNNTPFHAKVPGTIQAEDFYINEGLQLETTTDAGGGENIGYTNEGDYLEYLINVEDAGYYFLDVRVACESSAGILEFQQLNKSGDILHSSQVAVPVTGGWQSWRTVSTNLYLEAGRSTLKVVIIQPEFNVNWYKFSWLGLVNGADDPDWNISIYPNPSHSQITIKLPSELVSKYESLNLINLEDGKICGSYRIDGQSSLNIDIVHYSSGIYLLEIIGHAGVYHQKIIIGK